MYPIDFEKVGQRHCCKLCRSHRQSGGWALAGSCTPIYSCFQKMPFFPPHLWVLSDLNLCYSFTHSWNRAHLYSVFTVMTSKGLDMYFRSLHLICQNNIKKTSVSQLMWNTSISIQAYVRAALAHFWWKAVHSTVGTDTYTVRNPVDCFSLKWHPEGRFPSTPCPLCI